MLVTGLLARDEVQAGSDIGFPVARRSRHLKYAIEGIVEGCLEGLRFDVIDLGEIRTSFDQAASDASEPDPPPS